MKDFRICIQARSASEWIRRGEQDQLACASSSYHRDFDIEKSSTALPVAANIRFFASTILEMETPEMLARSLRIVTVAVLFGSPLWADSETYVLTMSGDQAVPGPGDSDGSASGIITLDDVTGEIAWNLSYADISAPTAMHIHGPDGSAGSAAGVFIGLGIDTTGPDGTLINSLVHPTLSDVTTILGDPADFYVNIHNADFPPGAVRSQLGVLVPEPGSLALLLLGVAGLARLRPSQS